MAFKRSRVQIPYPPLKTNRELNMFHYPRPGSSSYSIIANPKLIKDILNDFSDNLRKNLDVYDGADVNALSNSLYRAINAMENNMSKSNIEKWFDNHNHTMEFLRTLFGFIAAVTGIFVFLKVFGLI